MAKVEIDITTEPCAAKDHEITQYRTTLRLMVPDESDDTVLVHNRVFYTGMMFNDPETSEQFAVQQLGRALGRLIEMCSDGT